MDDKECGQPSHAKVLHIQSYAFGCSVENSLEQIGNTRKRDSSRVLPVTSPFDHVTTAALRVAKQDNRDDEELEAPSNAVKLAFDIKRLANIRLATAIKAGNEKVKKECKDFLKLTSLSYTHQSSSCAFAQTKIRKKKSSDFS